MNIDFDVNGLYLVLSFALPLCASLCALVRSPNVRDVLILAVACSLFVCVVKMYALFSAGQPVVLELWPLIYDVPIAFEVEPLGMLFALIVAFLWVVSTIYSVGYMRGNGESGQCKFYAFFALAIFATLGIAFASNLLTLFVFYELLTVLTFPLVTHTGTKEARNAGRVYLGILMGTSLMLLLPAVVITFYVTGTLDFTLGGILAGKSSDNLSALLLVLFMFGIGKAALMPFHRWLPAAMVAPTPVSALLHAVAVVKAGVFSVLKIIVYVFGVDYLHDVMRVSFWHGEWLLYVSGFTIVVASMVAMTKDNLKSRLAYSTVSQLSYVIMAAAMLTPKALIAAAFHLAAHAFGKITLFFAAGSIYTAAHKKNISQLSGIGKRMPWTMVAFAIAALSMIGIPPAVGFISKWYMVMGAVNEEVYFVIGVIVISTLLNAAYFLPVIYRAFFEEEKKTTGVSIASSHGEAPFPIVLALVVTACAVLMLFIFPGIFMGLAEGVVR